MPDRGRYSGQNKAPQKMIGPPLFPTFFLIILMLKIVCVYFYIEFSVEEAISLNFDCFSILTRVSENHFLTFFDSFPTFSRKIILKLV